LRSRIFASFLLLLLPLAALAAPGAFEIRNVGIDASLGFEIQGTLVAVRSSEARSNNTDLNSDGDTLDFVLQIVDAESGIVHNTALEASGGIRMTDRYVAFTVLESRQGGLDLNGDGDALDLVQFVHDSATGTTVNLALASSAFRIDADLLAFTVHEANQGGLDRNGDGDAKDQVLHLYDLSRGALVNLGLESAGGFVVSGSRVAFSVSESAQGAADRNGDGDALDSVLHVAGPSGSPVNLGAAVTSSAFQMDGDLLAFVVRESMQGAQDLNADSDAGDGVLHLHDFRTGSTRNVGRAVTSFQLDGSIVAFAQSESGQQNADANGDGDSFDDVLHYYDSKSSTVRNLAFAIEGYQLDGQHLAFGVREFRQAVTDLNGDGDTADLVLHLYDTELRTTTNLGTDTTLGFKLDGDVLLAFGASEAGQGVDLNGDGDMLDYALHVFDILSGTVLNLAVDPSGGFQSFQLDGRFLTFGVREAAQGGMDLNGDLDADDIVLHVFDGDSAATANLALDVTAGHQIQGGRIAFGVTEARQANADLNGDADTGDIVLHLANLSPDNVRERIEALIAGVRSLGLPRGVERSRVAMLEHALAAYDRDNPCRTILWLRVFKLSMRGHLGKKVKADDVRALRAEARAIIQILKDENPDCKPKLHRLCRRR
jgi:hypothetical protein